MKKKILSIILCIACVTGLMPAFGTGVSASNKGYSSVKALSYAQKNWNNGRGLCADFASKCIAAGGVNVYGSTVSDLFYKLDGTYGKAYKLTLTNGTKGRISMSANSGKLKAGDPVFYYCNNCKSFEHVVICNGANSEGYCQDYAHNKAHNGKKTTYSYVHDGGCYRENWTMYSIRMFEPEKLYGAKTDVGVPKIAAIANSADGIAVKWSAVTGADKYSVYRRQPGGGWVRLGNTVKNYYTDKTAQNGVTYTYTVRAVDGKAVSQFYAGKSVKCIESAELKSVTNYLLNVRVNWEKVEGADGYYVYRKAPGGSWVYIGNAKGEDRLWFNDKKVDGNEEYIYTVRAYSGSVKGCYDKDGINTVFLETPAEMTATANEEGIVITYPEIQGAESYAVYRKNSLGKWQLIESVENGKITSYTDSLVETGEEYCYTVRAVKNNYRSYFNTAGVLCEYN